MKQAQREFTAIYKKTGTWYVGWVEEIPGVNTQGKTLKEARENLADALALILETNKIVSHKEAGNADVIREQVTVTPS